MINRQHFKLDSFIIGYILSTVVTQLFLLMETLKVSMFEQVFGFSWFHITLT